MKRVGSFLGDWWRLVVPYFKSEERWIAISLLVGAIVLTLSSVAVEVALQRVEPALLRQLPEQGRGRLLAGDDQFQLDRRR